MKQVSDFIDYFPKLIEDLMGVFHSISKSNLFQRFNIEEFISDNSVSEWSSDFATEILPQIGMGFSSAVTFLVNTTLGFVLMPIMLFYMLKDGKKFSKLLIKRFPDSLKEDAILIMKDMDEGLSSFIQGQVIVSMSVGTLLYIGFLIIGVDYPLILALIAMLTNFIPSIGPVLGTIPAIIVAISISPFMVLKVIALVVVVQQLESLFISPQVIGRKLSIHPLLIIFILIIAGYLAGFLGLLFAVPTYVILKVIIEHIIRLYKLKKASQ
ncbi:putative PurR-regulated permease PerM [Desulfitispora alkaliphila]